MVMLVLLCQPQAVDARPLLDEAPASAVHSPAHCGVLDVLRDQEEQDEGEEGGGDDLSNEVNARVGTRACLGPKTIFTDKFLDHFERLRELRLWLAHLDVVLILEGVATVLLDRLEGILAVLNLA